MKFGRMREVIELQRKTVTRGDLGEQITGWATFARVFAEVSFDMGSEAQRRQTEGEFETPATFLIRHREDVTSADRVLYRSKAYKIDGLRSVSVTRNFDGLELRGVHRG